MQPRGILRIDADADVIRIRYISSRAYRNCVAEFCPIFRHQIKLIAIIVFPGNVVDQPDTFIHESNRNTNWDR
jgi:hypothetical protein